MPYKNLDVRREKGRERLRLWRKAHPDLVKAQQTRHAEKKAEWARNNPEKVAASRRRYKVKHGLLVHGRGKLVPCAGCSRPTEVISGGPNHVCKECRPLRLAAAKKRYADKNRSVHRAARLAYYRRNKEREKAGSRRWQSKNKAKVNGYARASYRARSAFFRRLKFFWQLERITITLENTMNATITETGETKAQAEFARYLTSMEKLGNDELQRIVEEGYKTCRKHILRSASAIKLLDERGVKMDMDKWWLKTLRVVASGNVFAAEVIDRFAGDTKTIDRVLPKPAEEQRRILDMPEDERKEYLRPKKAEQNGHAPRQPLVDHITRLRKLTNGNIEIQIQGASIILSEGEGRSVWRSLGKLLGEM